MLYKFSRHILTQRTEYDIITFGNGIVGNSFLASLKQQNITKSLSCLLMGRQKEHVSFEDYKFSQTLSRTFAISAASKKFLDSISAWEMVKNLSCQPVFFMQVWDSFGGKIVFSDNKNPLSFIVDEKVLSSAVEDAASSSDIDFSSLSIKNIRQDKALF